MPFPLGLVNAGEPGRPRGTVLGSRQTRGTGCAPDGAGPVSTLSVLSNLYEKAEVY